MKLFILIVFILILSNYCCCCSSSSVRLEFENHLIAEKIYDQINVKFQSLIEYIEQLNNDGESTVVVPGTTSLWFILKVLKHAKCQERLHLLYELDKYVLIISGKMNKKDI